MVEFTSGGADGLAPEPGSAIERRDEAIRVLMAQIRESVEILRALRAKQAM